MSLFGKTIGHHSATVKPRKWVDTLNAATLKLSSRAKPRDLLFAFLLFGRWSARGTLKLPMGCILANLENEPKASADADFPATIPRARSRSGFIAGRVAPSISESLILALRLDQQDTIVVIHYVVRLGGVPHSRFCEGGSWGAPMPAGLKRYYGRGHLHFVTFSCTESAVIYRGQSARVRVGRCRANLLPLTPALPCAYVYHIVIFLT
jgi:hypothetical protein